MKALFLTPHTLQGFSGGTIASKNFLKIVKCIFKNNISVVASSDSEIELKRLGITRYTCVSERGLFSKIFYFVTGKCVDRFTPNFKIEKKNIGNFTHIFIDNAMLGRFAKSIRMKWPGTKIITLHHNFERKFYADSKKPFYKNFFINQVIDYNQSLALKYSDINLTFTQKDLTEIENAYGSYPKSRNEVFGFYEEVNQCDFGYKKDDSLIKLIITGNLSLEKGYKGVIDFMNDIFLKLDSKKFSLIIAGKNPNCELLKITKMKENVQVIANPKSMSPLLQNANIYLNPSSIGSGIKIRNFDGLRAGLPVICHAGNEYGFEGFSKGSFSVYNSLESFKDSIKGANLNRESVYNEYKNNNSIEIGITKLKKLLDD